jgi:hypothetical protein
VPDLVRTLLFLAVAQVLAHFLGRVLERYFGGETFVGKPGLRMSDLCHHCPRCHGKSDPTENPPPDRRKCIQGGFFCAACARALHILHCNETADTKPATMDGR